MWRPRHALSLLALIRCLYAQSLPYNPSHILYAPNSSIAYIFQPSTGSTSQSTLQSVDLTNTLSTSSLSAETISNSLPFLQDDELVPYTPVIETDGSFTVLAGKCADGASGAQVWRYTPGSASESGTPKWNQNKTIALGGTSDLTGSNFLSAGVPFSDNVDGGNAATSIYVFGGMCPLSTSSAATWQENADYSNSMLQIAPKGLDYSISLVSSRGPPISQAGVSITPLPPTYSTNSNGAPLGQQQDFVLLGGHTQTAFINTSQVALFSLPQQSWSFVPVQQPTNTKTDLAVRQSVQQVTPRSGHTAILAEDGTSIILFGGWVGDINTPAEPQLAILELGAGYGGSGAWKWRVPQVPSDNLPGTGIFGHGATMLPGGVMMIAGGYRASGSPSRLFRRSSMALNNAVLFYDTSSNAWLQSYTAPAGLGGESNDKNPPGSTSQNVGLGTGLGFGAALLASVVIFYFWYSKRLRRAREDRARALLTYSSDGSSAGHMDQPFLDGGGIDGRGGEESALGRFWPTGGQAGSAFPRPPPMQHTTGMFVNVPSPTRGLRKGRNYQYHAAPRYDDKRMSKASGNIHPIAEQENEDGPESLEKNPRRDGLSDAEDKLREVERMLSSDDPFADPLPNPLGSHPVSPEDTVRRVPTSASRISIPRRKPVPDQEIPNWIETGADEAPNEDQTGRTSPSKSDDRTSSTLSDRSQRSTTSTNSITRTMSTRTGAILAAAVTARRRTLDQNESPTDGRTSTMPTDGGSIAPSYFRTRARSSTNYSITPGGLQSIVDDDDTIVTARSNMAQLQSDGQMLIGGHPELDRDGPYQRAIAASTLTSAQSRLSSNRGPPPVIPQRRRTGLVGSLRRALNVMSMTERTLSLVSSATEPYKDDMRSSSSSPTKERSHRAVNGPRRAVSDGGALLKQKRGQKDWGEKEWPPYKDIPDLGDWGEPRSSEEKRQAEEDWDVEGAASNRDFQIMFSIPKSRLRVVNDDMDRASLRSASDGAVSRNGSVKQLTREESLKILKARADGDKPRLPSTEEKEEDLEKAKAA